MGKIIFWIVIIFVALFVLRVMNLSKAKRRAQANTHKGGNASQTAMVRCVHCGVFLPRVDALPSSAGFTCGDAACVAKNR